MLWLLAALPVFVLLFLNILRWKKQTIKKIGEERLVSQLIRNYSSRLFKTKFIFLSLAFVMGVLAIANLRKPGGSDGVSRKGIDVVIALDVSKSMWATDLAPNRLERAKQMIGKLMDEMPDDRIGLVLFAGKAYLQMPLTTDHGAAKLFVSAASPDAIPQQGTVISDALTMGTHAFNAKERRFKTIILITDGEDHDLDAEKTAAELAEQGVMVNTVGIGSAEGSPIIDPSTGEEKKDLSGNTVITKLNEDELQMIAQKTNGIYVHLQSSEEAVAAIKKQLSQIDRKAYGDVSLMNYSNYFGWFAAGMFLLLLLEIFIPERRSFKQV